MSRSRLTSSAVSYIATTDPQSRSHILGRPQCLLALFLGTAFGFSHCYSLTGFGSDFDYFFSDSSLSTISNSERNHRALGRGMVLAFHSNAINIELPAVLRGERRLFNRASSARSFSFSFHGTIQCVSRIGRCCTRSSMYFCSSRQCCQTTTSSTSGSSKLVYILLTTSMYPWPYGPWEFGRFSYADYSWSQAEVNSTSSRRAVHIRSINKLLLVDQRRLF
jgi:hypothetical protein